MTISEEVICPKCHHMRLPNLKIPCERCGAKQSMFGYLWPHELRGYITLGIGIGVVIVLTLLAIVAFWIILQLNSQQASVGFYLAQTIVSQ